MPTLHAFPRLLAIAALIFLCSNPASAVTTATVNAAVTITPSISLTPTSISFGQVPTGTTSSKTLTVKNIGVAAATFSVGATGNAQFSQSSECAGALAVGATCQVAVSFNPTATGVVSGAVQVIRGADTFSASLSGTGTAPASGGGGGNPPPPPPPPASPVSISLSPSSIQIDDDATAGSIVSVATITMSDGTTSCPTCTLTTSDTHYYQISGLNIVLAHTLTAADDGPHPSTITVNGSATPPAAPTPTSFVMSPASPSVPDNAAGGTVVATAIITMSDGTSTCTTCTLTTSDTSLYVISGLNVVLNRRLTQADDGSHPTTITVNP